MKKFLPIIIAVVLLLIGGATFMGVLPLPIPGLAPSKAAVSPVVAQKALFRKERKAMKLRMKQRLDGPTVDLEDDVVVNLADTGLAHFAKFSVSLKVDKATPLAAAGAEGAAGPAALEDAAAIKDLVNSAIRSRTAHQLSTPGGIADLKKDIEADVAHETNTLILDVYFTGFAIQ